MESVGRTRMNLLLLKRQILVAERGLELLRSKRESIVREFFAVMDRVVESRGQMEASMEHALSSLAVALGMEGRAPLRSAGYAAQRTLLIEQAERNVWGSASRIYSTLLWPERWAPAATPSGESPSISTKSHAGSRLCWNSSFAVSRSSCG